MSEAIRIGTSERESAIRALGEHMNAGRLEPDEYGDRVAAASVARTEIDLEPLFCDLPAPHWRKPAPIVPPAPEWAPPPAPVPPAGQSPFGGRTAAVLVALSPFVAIALMVGLHIWFAFLLIPIVGTLVYGGRNRHHGYGRRPYGRR
jgi:hypothetical protein